MTGLWNCHAIGLHSIVLYQNGDMLRRMFFTTKDHELHRNWSYSNPSIAFHPHRFDITLIPITKNATNVILDTTEVPRENNGCTVAKWRYKSQLISGEGSFWKERDVSLKSMAIKHWPMNVPRYMSADVVHSVFVPKSEEAAWIVEEGRPYPDQYENIAYSNADLSSWSSDGLYQPMDEEEIFETIKKYLL